MHDAREVEDDALRGVADAHDGAQVHVDVACVTDTTSHHHS